MSQQHILPVTLPPSLSQEPLKSASPPTDTQQEQVKQPTSLPVSCQKVSSELPREALLEHGEKHTTPMKGVPEQDCEPQSQKGQQQEQHLEQQQQESQKQELHLEPHLDQKQHRESQKQELQQQKQHLEQKQQQDSQEQELHPEQHLKQLERCEQEVKQHQQEQHEDQAAENLEQQLEKDKAQKEQQLKEQLEQEKKILDQQLDQELAKRDEQLEKKEEQLLEHLGQGQLGATEQQKGQLEQPTLVPVPGQVQETHPVQPLQGEVLFSAEEQQKKQEV
ncbi:involucrin [Artibeus jamaicensis]|uniref:involucrin n=1 Tax=Artibeus jamaicensis TaxID=9417 RepID=UPI00235AFBD0|nr:involucrin [Artibeus jamaicensis]